MPSGTGRWMALLCLVVVFGGGGWGTLAFFRHQRDGAEDPVTPFYTDSLVGVGPDLRPVAVPRSAPVVLYVSAHCPFCRAELRAWSRFLAIHREQRPPWVVFAPDTPVREARTLAGAFAGHWMTDPTGAVARRLRVRAVPFVAVLDSAGLVEEARSGMSSPGRLAALAAIISPTSRSKP